MHQRLIVVRVAVHWSSGIKDTVEAKLLQPAIDADVTLYEDVARWTVCRVWGVARMISHWKTCFSYLLLFVEEIEVKPRFSGMLRSLFSLEQREFTEQNILRFCRSAPRNPISAMSQSTRWMLGEVRNCCYEKSGSSSADLFGKTWKNMEKLPGSGSWDIWKTADRERIENWKPDALISGIYTPVVQVADRCVA